jgi:hypothetical protein
MERLCAADDMAMAMWHCLGDCAGARPLFAESLAVRRRALGGTNPETLRSMHNLALLHQAMGNNALGMPLHEEALARRRRMLGDAHHDTLSSIVNCASAHAKIDSHSHLARTLYEEALVGQRMALGNEHVRTLTCMILLAGLYHKKRSGFELAVPVSEPHPQPNRLAPWSGAAALATRWCAGVPQPRPLPLPPPRPLLICRGARACSCTRRALRRAVACWGISTR